jgi:hypothetical protein
MGLPGSHRRSSAERRDSLTPILEESIGRAAWIKNTVAVFAVCVAGSVGWAIAWKSGVWHPTPEHAGNDDKGMVFGGQILGYISAVCYLGYVSSNSEEDNADLITEHGSHKSSRTNVSGHARVSHSSSSFSPSLGT